MRNVITMLNKEFLQPINSKSKVTTVVDRITNAIIDRELEPGQKLPTEAQLSEKLHIGRNSIREAVKILTALGILEIRRADGTYVSEEFSDNMINPLVYSMILEQDASQSIYEIRSLFEIGAVEIAIQKSTDEDIEELEKMLRVMEKEANRTEPNLTKFTELDMEFHQKITAITKNSLIVTIGNVIGRLTRPSQLKTVQFLMETGNMEFLVDIHREIVDLFVSKNYLKVRGVIDKSHYYWRKNIE